MGNCEAVNYYCINKKSIKNYIGNIESYKFECHKKKILKKKKLFLGFTFSQIRIKHCLSHSPSKNSTYITELSIGQKAFNLIVNKGKEPIINSENIFEITKEFTIKELEKTFLSINIYEFIEENNLDILKKYNILPPELKNKCKYRSFFNMDLLSFLCKSKKCDFLMMGNNQLSTNTRISFICDILHKEKIKITAKNTSILNISQLTLKTKNYNLNGAINILNNKLSLETPYLTMKEFQHSDLFLESNENENPYRYITLNDLKFTIIKKLGENIIKEENKYKEFKSKNQVYENTNMGYSNYKNNQKNLFKCDSVFFLRENQDNLFKLKEENENASLTLENLPIITQISSLYFTEYGHLYSTSLLYLINNDINIINYRKDKQISSDLFYERLKNIYDFLCKNHFDFNELFTNLNNNLRTSIDTEKFYCIYPDLDSLVKMIIIMMNIGIKMIEIVQKINDENKLNIILKVVYNLIKREELENGVLNYCLSKYQDTNNNLKNIHNTFIINILKLNEFCKVKQLPNINPVLIEIYSLLYFKKKYIREAIFNTIWNEDKNYDNHQIDIFIYDISKDYNLNRYLDQNMINPIIKKGYFSNLFLCGNIFFINIISKLNSIDINEYPFDFTLFIDNQNILNFIVGFVNFLKIENLGNDFFDLALLFCDSYQSISTINNCIITNTNGYNNICIFKLIDYLKNLLQFYYSKEQSELIMDYSFFEQAINAIIKIDNSISISKLFAFYYNCSHLILSGHLKCIIMNICNNSFNYFAFHWSFTIRQIFFKLILFIFNNRIKNEEGKIFKQENFQNFNKQIQYRDESVKDYNIVNNEFMEWKGDNTNEDKEYPIIAIQISNGLDSLGYAAL